MEIVFRIIMLSCICFHICCAHNWETEVSFKQAGSQLMDDCTSIRPLNTNGILIESSSLHILIQNELNTQLYI